MICLSTDDVVDVFVVVFFIVGANQAGIASPKASGEHQAWVGAQVASAGTTIEAPKVLSGVRSGEGVPSPAE